MSRNTFLNSLLQRLNSPHILFVLIVVVGLFLDYIFVQAEPALPYWVVDLLHEHRF